jgi:hypothetical protein
MDGKCNRRTKFTECEKLDELNGRQQVRRIKEFNHRANIIALVPLFWHDASIPAQAHAQ